MGSNSINVRGSSFDRRYRDHEKMFNAIHRARVTDVFVDKGTMAVILEGVSYSAQITIPLLGLSAPPGITEEEREQGKSNFKAASWGRYIPQVGDLILVGFGSNGDLYALGYSAIFYRGFDFSDAAEESTGGIGWGETSGRQMKPGDWDFRSARAASLYLGERASLAAGPYSVAVNAPTDDITITAPLLIGSIGTSRLLFGMVERVVLPTDRSATSIPSPRAGTTAQEGTIKVRWNGGPVDGQELATWSIGDVIDDDDTTAFLRLSNATVPQPVRRYFNSVDNTGYITSYTEMVDAGGNFEVTAPTATDFQWSTVLANWKIDNLSTGLTSVAGIDMSCNALFNITGTGGVVLDSSALIQLGGSGATEPFVMGLKWQSLMNALLTALVSHTHPIGAVAAGPSADLAVSIPTAIQPQVALSLSSKVLGS
jgi:hypothetical protein